VARGFVNLNRFKHGRAMKQNSKQKADLQGSKGIKGQSVKPRGWKRLTCL
jgi:hypothetical protein